MPIVYGCGKQCVNHCALHAILFFSRFEVNARANSTLYEWLTILCMLVAIGALLLELVGFQGARSALAPGTIMAGLPVGNLAPEQAAALLRTAYSAPVELHYIDQTLLLDPAQISLRLDTDAMLAQAETYRTGANFWSAFWDDLWQRPVSGFNVPLALDYSPAQLRTILLDTATRYDLAPAAPVADIGTFNISDGRPGYALDVESSMTVIDMALRVPDNRRAALTIAPVSQVAPTMQTLGQLAQDYVRQAGFDGLLSMVVLDLKTGAELSLNPDVAYAGMSMMKVPILIDTYRRLDADPVLDEITVIEGTIVKSSNVHANILLMELGDGEMQRGAENLTGHMRQLGLQNTFMAGYFDQRDPPPKINTPANQRTDFNTYPDPYMQTTPADMAVLMTGLYQCASNGGGVLPLVFPGQITQAECTAIVDLLKRNDIATLIEAGVPEGSVVAHKHGFSEGDTIGDAGIVFSPAGDYVLVVYLWREGYLEWQRTAPLVANISRMVYTFFNH